MDLADSCNLRAPSFLSADLFQMEKRGSEVDGKIKQLDEELLRYKTQMSKMRPGPAKNQVQQRALRVLKQKKMSAVTSHSAGRDGTRAALLPRSG